VPTTDFCPNCGTHLEADTTACPNCGAPVHGALAGPAPTGLAAVVRSIKTKPFVWGGSVLAVAAAAFVVFGGMMGPSGEIVCTATLKQARDFGVISPSATLDSNDAASTDVGNRKSCVARVGNDTYTMVADIKKVDNAHKACRDYTKQAGCIALYSVARSDGMTTYQVRPIDPNDTDEALAKRGLLGLPPGGARANSGNEAAADGGLETETAVDNSAGMQSAPAQQQAAPQQ
jgi:hypothetical protein